VSPLDDAFVAVAGLLAGGVNAIAGGGTLISFPALLATGTAAVTANITSSVGLVSGYLGGAVGYRRELAGQRSRVVALGASAVAGGIAGAVILLVTPADSFRAVVPYLVLLSCALLAAQPRTARWVAARAAARADDGRSRRSGEIGPALQAGVFVASVYGSYFGAGLGVLLLAVLGILLQDELQRLNVLKTVLAFVVNIVGVVVFLVSGRVAWVFAVILLVTAYLGGVLGARVARRLRASTLRAAVITLGVVVSVVLIVRG
jgi:uncharacterized membrane protein YfcA